MALTGLAWVSSTSIGIDSRPFSSRHPKYPVPTWKMRSPPCWWCTESPPSPVLCMAPAMATPWLMARTALPDSDP